MPGGVLVLKTPDRDLRGGVDLSDRGVRKKRPGGSACPSAQETEVSGMGVTVGTVIVENEWG